MLIYDSIIIVGKVLISHNYHSTKHQRNKYSITREPNYKKTSVLDYKPSKWVHWKEIDIIRGDKIFSVKRADMEIIMTGSYRNEVKWSEY